MVWGSLVSVTFYACRKSFVIANAFEHVNIILNTLIDVMLLLISIGDSTMDCSVSFLIIACTALLLSLFEWYA